MWTEYAVAKRLSQIIHATDFQPNLRDGRWQLDPSGSWSLTYLGDQRYQLNSRYHSDVVQSLLPLLTYIFYSLEVL